VWAISGIFQKLPKEINRPLGENSPHLVTLPAFPGKKKFVFPRGTKRISERIFFVLAANIFSFVLVIAQQRLN
jgi:hypothetical protein